MNKTLNWLVISSNPLSGGFFQAVWFAKAQTTGCLKKHIWVSPVLTADCLPTVFDVSR
ncbi:hypothetical protein [Stenoxybacter acetivorans]|uniref:hypothetical protein n=1 Tax=Stenoxybacter acetivorans TaxID=422441 RepID=UPI0012ECACA9|nr:hypothetical protein [Stenoxybacter acetivorans]